MSRDEADPVPLTPDARTNGDLRVELNGHLEIAFEERFRDGEGSRRGRIALKSADHCFVVAFLWRFGWSDGGCAVDGFVQDGIIGIVFFHGAEVVGAFKEVLSLARGVLCADRLAVDALRR